MTPLSPKARVPPKRVQSMNPNLAAQNNQQLSNGQPALQRGVTSDQMQSTPTQKSGNTNGRPAPPQRTPSLPNKRDGNNNGQPPSTPTRSQRPDQQRPTPPPRVPSPRRLDSAGTSNGQTMSVPSTPKREQEHRAVPHTPSTPKRQQPQQQHHPQSRPGSPQRTISLPANNVQPNRPMAGPPEKSRIDSGNIGNRNASDTMLSPKRAKSMPVPSQSNSSQANNANVNGPKQLSPIT